ncbi:MAG: accessory factor UbiK family protein [Pseudohongiellaceae bacterium]
MLDNSFLKDLSDRLVTLLPAAESLRDDVGNKIEQTLKKAFASLDLLTREEFDAQVQSLDRSKQRIEELENLVTELEKQLDALNSASK